MAYNKNKAKANKTKVNSRLQAEADSTIRGPAVKTFRAQELPYTYTSACPGLTKKVPPRLRGGVEFGKKYINPVL